MVEIGILDWVIWLVYASLVVLLLFVYKNTKAEKYYRFMLPGFLIKLFGGVAFSMVYIHYYGFGDTFLYHKGASVLSETMINHPQDYLRLLFSESQLIESDLAQYTKSISYSRTYEEWFMVKILSPINFISFGSYLVTTFFMSLISFFGAWKLFKVFVDIAGENYTKIAFFAAFLIPSTIFWGSGILKDTITLAAINYLIYLLYFSFFKGKIKLFSFVGILLIMAVILKLKAYILLSFIPGLAFGLYLKYKQSIRSVIIRVIVGPLILILLSIGSFLALETFLSQEGKYNVEMLEKRVNGFHTWHKDLGGSYYDLGEVDYTFSGIISKVPSALNATYFRPYIWEARNSTILVGALESLFFLGLFIYVLVLAKFRLWRKIRKNPLLSCAFIFCLIFGFAVGFTSFNFGALARYKIPVFSLAVFILLYLLVNIKDSKKSKN
jgi:hypothetical protein